MRDKIIIYGGSSLISKYLFFEFYKDDYEFIVFCRDKKKVTLHIESLKLDPSRFTIHNLSLEDINKNFKIIDNLNYKIKGIIWVAGAVGNPNEEMLNAELAKNNYYINLINPVLFIDYLIPKLSDGGFISAVTSVAGLRGRSKRLFYGSAKAGLINYLSGLRQFLHKRGIFVNTIIPGYISTERFNIKASKFLITSPSKTAKMIYQSIKNKKEIIYINFFWRIISFILNLIPEKIFKKFNF
jgi:short-subunit dehydrogenase|tara:strand:+ start:682 stop:1404 length:723 start_codon:yes stop_codon:yes gene_type:complete